MPAEPFSVHVDPDDLKRQDLAAAVAAGARDSAADRDRADGTAAHHGAKDARQAAKQRSERDRAGRAAGAAGGRSYAFRRS